MARKEIIELLAKYFLLLKNEGISIKKAFLFGSYADEVANENSDIDVLIVSDNYDESSDLMIGKVWSLTRKVNTKIEPLLIGVKKFSDENTSPLIEMIKSKGIQLI